MIASPFQSVVWAVIGIVVALGFVVLVRFWLRRRAHRDRQATPAIENRLSSASTEANWPAWETSIRNALLQDGWVDEYMVSSSVPQSLRVPAMRRYVEEHSDDALIFQESPPRIELANRGRIAAGNNWPCTCRLADEHAHTRNAWPSRTAGAQGRRGGGERTGKHPGRIGVRSAGGWSR